MMNDGQLPAGGEDVVEIRRKRGRPRNDEREVEERPIDDKVEKLLAELGGGGRVVVYRIVDGTEHYSVSYPVDESVTSEVLDQRLSEACGGGKFNVKFYKNGKYCGGVYRHIDILLHAQKPTTREAERGQQQGVTPVQPLPPMQDPTYLAERERQFANQQAQLSNQQHNRDLQMMATMMQMQERSTIQMMEMVRTMAGAPARAATPISESLSTVNQIMQFANTLGFRAPGESASSPTDDMSFGERVLIGPLNHLAGVVGEKVGDALKNTMVPQTPAAAPIPLPAPIQLPPPVMIPEGATLTQAPILNVNTIPLTQRPKTLHGMKPLTPEQVKAQRDSIRIGKPSVVEAAPPKVTDILPSAGTSAGNKMSGPTQTAAKQ